MSDPFEVDGATAPYESIYTVVLREQELSEIGPILSCNPCNQCFALHLLGSSVLIAPIVAQHIFSIHCQSLLLIRPANSRAGLPTRGSEVPSIGRQILSHSDVLAQSSSSPALSHLFRGAIVEFASWFPKAVNTPRQN